MRLIDKHGVVINKKIKNLKISLNFLKFNKRHCLNLLVFASKNKKKI